MLLVHTNLRGWNSCQRLNIVERFSGVGTIHVTYLGENFVGKQCGSTAETVHFHIVHTCTPPRFSCGVGPALAAEKYWRNSELYIYPAATPVVPQSPRIPREYRSWLASPELPPPAVRAHL